MTTVDDVQPVVVKAWGDASSVLTDHARRLREHEQRIEASEIVTAPIRKVWAAIKWGWIPGAILLISGASPSSPLGQLMNWLTTGAP
jgi:hypothetical protein